MLKGGGEGKWNGSGVFIKGKVERYSLSDEKNGVLLESSHKVAETATLIREERGREQQEVSKKDLKMKSEVVSKRKTDYLVCLNIESRDF